MKVINNNSFIQSIFQATPKPADQKEEKESITTKISNFVKSIFDSLVKLITCQCLREKKVKKDPKVEAEAAAKAKAKADAAAKLKTEAAAKVEAKAKEEKIRVNQEKFISLQPRLNQWKTSIIANRGLAVKRDGLVTKIQAVTSELERSAKILPESGYWTDVIEKILDIRDELGSEEEKVRVGIDNWTVEFTALAKIPPELITALNIRENEEKINHIKHVRYPLCRAGSIVSQELKAKIDSFMIRTNLLCDKMERLFKASPEDAYCIRFINEVLDVRDNIINAATESDIQEGIDEWTIELTDFENKEYPEE